MKNTGAGKSGRYLDHGVAIYATYRSFSAARFSDILPESYLLAEQSPGSSQFRGENTAFHADLPIIKENPPIVKRIFSVFDENLKIFL